jgi:hypothetical protein
MLLQIGKAVSFILSLLSLHAVLVSAFFVPGSRWQDRIFASLSSLLLSGCICFASGLLFCMADESRRAKPQLPEPHLTDTLPVRIFFWAVGAMAVLFLLSWYLDTYYVPLLWRNQPH